MRRIHTSKDARQPTGSYDRLSYAVDSRGRFIFADHGRLTHVGRSLSCRVQEIPTEEQSLLSARSGEKNEFREKLRNTYISYMHLIKCIFSFSHATCKIEFQPFNRSYSQMTYFNFYKIQGLRKGAGIPRHQCFV